jgi:hypothetical protein
MTSFEREPNNPLPATHYAPPAGSSHDRVVELEIENARLNRLVAELLIKNQQLRKPD